MWTSDYEFKTRGILYNVINQVRRALPECDYWTIMDRCWDSPVSIYWHKVY